MDRLVVQWPRLGPLHLNRLRAAHQVLGEHGLEVVALETASDSDAYAWRLENDPTSFERVTVFSGENYDDVSPRRMHAEVWAELTRLDPVAVHIHSFSTPDARACLAWCRYHGRVALCMAESNKADTTRNWGREVIKKVLVSQFDAAQSAGTLATDYITELGLDASRVFTGYSVVDNDYFATRAAAVQADRAEARHLPELADESPFFFASARFMERKNLLGLLKAYAEYRRASPDPWRLILLGDGALRPRLESFIALHHLEGVEMPGWRQIEDLPLYYGLASVFVHSASTDQWALVINEAMAAGLPVIASTGAGATHDLVEHGRNGFRFCPDDIPSLAEHLLAMAHKVNRDAFGRRSREIIARWPLERFGTSLLKAYHAGCEGDLDRGFNFRGRALVWSLMTCARNPRSFHAIEA